MTQQRGLTLTYETKSQNHNYSRQDSRHRTGQVSTKRTRHDRRGQYRARIPLQDNTITDKTIPGSRANNAGQDNAERYKVE